MTKKAIENLLSWLEQPERAAIQELIYEKKQALDLAEKYCQEAKALREHIQEVSFLKQENARLKEDVEREKNRVELTRQDWYKGVGQLREKNSRLLEEVEQWQSRWGVASEAADLAQKGWDSAEKAELTAKALYHEAEMENARLNGEIMRLQTALCPHRRCLVRCERVGILHEKHYCDREHAGATQYGGNCPAHPTKTDLPAEPKPSLSERIQTPSFKAAVAAKIEEMNLCLDCRAGLEHSQCQYASTFDPLFEEDGSDVRLGTCEVPYHPPEHRRTGTCHNWSSI